jgi:phospholipase C
LRPRLAVILLALIPVIAGCSSHSIGPRAVPGMNAASEVHTDGKGPASKLKHIVIVIQENRTVDNLFNGFCINGGITCAKTVTVDPVSGTPLVSQSLAGSSNPNHAHNNFLAQFDNGKMDGFGKQSMPCKGPPPCTVFSYVPVSEVQSSYWALATSDGVLSDATFETPQGPSLPSHYYSIAGQSGGYDDDHWAIEGGSGSCKTTAQNAEQILMTTGQQGNKTTPCKDFQTIFDSLATAGHSWRYYTNSTQGFWSVPENIQHLYGSPNIVIPSTQFLSDVANNNLADVTYVAPKSGAYSDHPGMAKTWCYGPDWVAQVVNAVGQSPYWKNTAVVLYWDDWGGWFDHVVPPAGPLNPDPFEYGFRVPLIVISPYAKVGTIDHTARTYVSTLRLIEETFKVPSLGTTDKYEPDGLDSMFDFAQKPIKYAPINPPTGTNCTGGGARPSRSFGTSR